MGGRAGKLRGRTTLAGRTPHPRAAHSVDAMPATPLFRITVA